MDYIRWLRHHVGSRKVIVAYADVILRDDAGRVLLQHRADFDEWGLIGGALELDETIEQCARRELAEEAALTAGALRLVGIYTDPRYDVVYPNGDAVQQFTVVFTGTVNGGTLRWDAAESRLVAWTALSDIPWTRMADYYGVMLRAALAGGPPLFLGGYSAESTHEFFRAVRPLVGHAPLILPGTMTAVVDAAGRLLLMRRADSGQWWLPAGFIDIGENAAHCAAREVAEETGITVAVERIVGIYSGPAFCHTFANGDAVYNVGVVFRARPIGGALQPGAEATDAAWVAPAALADYVDPNGPFFPILAQTLACLEDGVFVL